MCYKWRHHNPIFPFTTRCTPVGPYLNPCVYFQFRNLFILIQNDYTIKGIEIFEYCYLYTAYGDGTTCFLKDENSIVHLSEKFKLFSYFLGLKPNTTKCEIAGIGVLKGVQAAVCGIKCIDLRNEAIKILAVYFSCNQKIKDEKKF